MSNNEYKELFFKESVEKKLNIVFDGGIITNTELHSNQFELTESICSEESLRFGGCEASVLKFKVSNIYSSLVGKELDVSMFINGDTENPYRFGKFKVYSDTPTADRSFKDIVAYDKMYEIINSDVAEWYNSLTFPMTLKEFRSSFVAHYGIEEVDIVLVNDDMMVEKTIETVELSGRDVARAICEINGCFGHINRNNEFEYVVLPEISYIYPQNILYPSNALYPLNILDNSPTISRSHYISCQYEDFKTHRIDGVDVYEDGESIGNVINDGNNIYIIQDNFLIYGKSTTELTTILTSLLGLISVAEYRPASIIALGNPAISLGEVIRLTTRHQAINTYVLNRTISGIQALRDNFNTSGVEYYEKDVNSVKNEIIKLKSKTNKLTRSVEETVSKIEDVEKKVSTEIKQTAEGLTVEINIAKYLADDAAKYATNYLDLGSEGLIVGNMASDVLGKNVLIGSDSVSIRENNVVLAEYSEDKIELGKNSEHSIIELCGGKALMGVVEEVNQNKSFVIKALEDSLKMESSKSMNFQCLLEQYGLHLNSFITANIRNENPYILISANKYTDDGSISELSRTDFGNGKLLITTKNSDGVGVEIDLNGEPGCAILNGILKVSGGIYAGGEVNAGSKAKMWTDSEGGQFQILSQNDVEWSMDAYNDNFRLYKIKDGTYYCPLYIDGDNDVQVNDLWADVTSGERHIGFIDNGAYGAFLYSQPNGNGTRIGLYDNFVAGSIWQVLDDGYMHHNVHNEFNSGITLPYNKYIYFGGNGYIYSSGGQALYIAASSERAYALYLGVWDSAWTLCPNNDTNLRLGSPSCRWGNIYSTNATISTSDRNLKKDIQPLTDKHLKFFTMLQPVSFKFIDGTSNRTHIGFISQDVEEAMTACGLSDLDFAGFCKDQKTERVEKTVEVEKEVPKEMIDETTGETYIGTEIVVEEQTIEEDVPIEGKYIYSLRYEEFIALNTCVIQKQQSEIEMLKNEIEIIKKNIGL